MQSASAACKAEPDVRVCLRRPERRRDRFGERVADHLRQLDQQVDIAVAPKIVDAGSEQQHARRRTEPSLGGAAHSYAFASDRQELGRRRLAAVGT
ncbi:MAG: hypothetical protein H6931_09205 [Burkholderiaceae bacterium]|nr:hypothetical protein [Burkholderiaceae bacterium]